MSNIASLKSADVAAEETSGMSRRRKLFIGLIGVVGAVILIAVGHWFFIGRYYISTDDAYVDAQTAQITPLISAAVIQVPVTDTQHVNAGDRLVVLDDADFKLAVIRAEAHLSEVTRKVEGYFRNDDALAAQIAAREAEIDSARARLTSAESDLARARTDFERRKALAPSGAVSGDELTSSENRLRNTEAAQAAARAALLEAEAQKTASIGARKINQALIAGTTVEDNPEVAAARADLAKAKLDLDRAIIRAPIDGVVTRSTVQIGQRVQAGAALMSVVPIDDAYVNANFKEVQLDRVKPGQTAELTSDLYGSGVVFHGTVQGLAGGTGAAFALIPAQNATGNWIKVVQRLPVRIALDPNELRVHPLRVGLSMTATIDLRSK